MGYPGSGGVWDTPVRESKARPRGAAIVAVRVFCGSLGGWNGDPRDRESVPRWHALPGGGWRPFWIQKAPWREANYRAPFAVLMVSLTPALMPADNAPDGAHLRSAERRNRVERGEKSPGPIIGH